MSTFQTDFPILGESVEAAPMGVPKLLARFTVDEYLALERAAFERHIFLDGQIFAMSGESGQHGDISANLAATTVAQLKGKPCRARTKDTKVRSGPIPDDGSSTKGMFSYPDIVVICGEPEYHDALKDVILNPSVIFEVLSPSTETFDRGEKFQRYQTWNPTLTDYVLVSQDKPQVEHFQKQASGSWSHQRTIGVESNVVIASIGTTLALADLYDRVVFSETPLLPGEG